LAYIAYFFLSSMSFFNKNRGRERGNRDGNLGISVIMKSSVYAELLVPLRLVAILEANKLKLLSFSFMISR